MKFEIGDKVRVNTPTEIQFHDEVGFVSSGNPNRGYDYLVILEDGRKPSFTESELTPVPERKPQTQGEIAAAVIQFLMSGMVKNNAYEFDGKPIFDSLTTQHIGATMEEFRNRNEFGEPK